MDVRLSKLSENFYEDYPHEIYPEILEKQNRPYFCITFFDERGFYICIPYRSYISHPNDAYFFDFSRRYPRRRRVLPCSGLDYTKIVIIQKEEYISDEQVVINTQQYRDGMNHIARIKYEAMDYVNTYIEHWNNIRRLNEHDYIRRYRCSSLQYFHNELEIHE